MQLIGKYLKKHILFIIRCVSLGCLLFIATWSLSDYEFSDGLLYGFPMFCLPYEKVMADKKVVALLFPLIINVALWAPFKKSYPLIFGVWVVEKWKAMLITIGSAIIFLGSVMYSPNGSGEYFWSFFFAIGYFILLYYGLKEISGEEFLKRHEIKEKSQAIESKAKAAALVYAILVFAYIAEYNLQRYYIPAPLEASIEYSIGDGFVRDISSDEKTFIYFNDKFREESKRSKGVFKIYDMKTGNLVKSLEQDSVVHGQYGADNNQLIVQKAGGIFIYDVGTGETIREFPNIDDLNYGVDKIQYSTDKKIFATVGTGVLVYDSETGKLLNRHNEWNYEKEFIWLDYNKYFMIQQNREHFSKKEKWKAELGEVNRDKGVEIIEKKKIAEILAEKTKGFYYTYFFIKSIKNEKIVAVVIHGIPSNGWLRYKSYLIFLDVEKEEVIFSLDSNYSMNYVEIFLEQNRFVTIEGMKNDWVGRGRDKVTVWNLQTKEKEKTITISGMEGDERSWVKIVQGGHKIMELRKKVKVWNID